MTKPTFEELIASARGDEPTPAQLQALEHKLASLLPPGSGGGPSGHGGGAGGAAGGGVALKWIAAGVIAVGGGVAVQQAVSHHPSPTAPVVAPAPPVAEVVPPPSVDAAPEPPPVVAPVREPRPHAPADTLAAETALLDRARAALQRGDAAAALASCDVHAKKYARGVLREERERIAIEALAALGRRDEATARTQRFDRAFPNSVQSERLHALVRAR